MGGEYVPLGRKPGCKHGTEFCSATRSVQHCPSGSGSTLVRREPPKGNQLSALALGTRSVVLQRSACSACYRAPQHHSGWQIRLQMLGMNCRSSTCDCSVDRLGSPLVLYRQSGFYLHSPGGLPLSVRRAGGTLRIPNHVLTAVGPTLQSAASPQSARRQPTTANSNRRCLRC